MRVQELFAFIKERNSIHDKKEKGLPKPWTYDPILQNYRFCNVYREEDTQTKWFAKNWRVPNSQDPYLWFAALVFRFINWHETAAELGYPVPWDPARFKRTLQARKKAGEKVYSGAYMISTHGAKEEKHLYLAKSLSKIWKRRVPLMYTTGEALDIFHKGLMSCYDVGSFIAGQVIADAKYCGNMRHAPDWWTFAASGPGSQRGLARVLNLATDHPWKEAAWRGELSRLQEQIDPMIKEAKMPRLHAQDLQNCLCEWDKYQRVKLGEGKPKQKYNGGKD